MGFLRDGDRVRGVTLLNRQRNETYEVQAPVVISTVGPGTTLRMCEESGLFTGSHQARLLPAATGLKLQVHSLKSLIDHDSIMFCLDTKRVAGVLQISNLDPTLAPPGKHLLISHQTIRPALRGLKEMRIPTPRECDVDVVWPIIRE